MDVELYTPDLLMVARTVLIPQNKEPHVVKTYRPIACLNVMYKLYTGNLDMYFQDEQARGKRRVGVGLY